MGIQTAKFWQNPNIGLYGFGTDKYCLVGDLFEKDEGLLKSALEANVIKERFFGTDLAGIFSAGNSKGVIVPEIFDSELKALKREVGVLVLKTKYTALGNLILCNDKGCVIAKELKSFAHEIGDFLGVNVEIGTIVGLELVGSLAVCTNRGCIVHKEASAEEIEAIKKALKVRVEPATANFGSGFVKSGIIANSKGLVFGDMTTGPEMANISEVLGFANSSI